MVVGVGAQTKQRASIWMAGPALLVISAVVVYPLVFSAYFSLREVHPNLVGEWVGLANYKLMFEDPSFERALGTTVLFALGSTGLSFVIGLAVALALNRDFTGRALVIAAVLLPWIFPTVVTASIGRLMVNSQGGVVNYAARTLGLISQPILLDRSATLVAAILLDVWRSVPFVAVLLLAGLQRIPAELHDAARVDGASSVQRLVRITLPLLRPVLLIVLLFRVLDALRVFDLFYVMTLGQLESISTYIYEKVTLSQIYFGLGMAAAVFAFALALLIALGFTGLLRAQVSSGLEHFGYYGPSAENKSIASVGSKLSFQVVLGLVVLISVAPIVWVLKMSVVSTSEIMSSPPTIVPHSFSLSYYAAVLGSEGFLRSLSNSLLIAGSTTFLALLLSAPAAYSLSRLESRFSNQVLAVTMAIAFFPPTAVLTPMLVQLGQLGLVNTYWSSIIPDVAFFSPFAVWLLTAFFRELPKEVEEAARVDGAGTLQILSRIIVPLVAPGVLATGALIFVLTWNEFIFGRTFMFDVSIRPVTVVLGDFIANATSTSPYFYGIVAASSLIATILPVILILAFYRRILTGMSGGAIKNRQRGAGRVAR